MSDPSSPDLPSAEPTVSDASSAGPGQELEVDLAAFLPEGVALGHETVIDDEIAIVATDDGVVAIEDVVVATDDGIVVIEEIVAVAAPSAPPVDLEALSQIERDLDAVDAAIAALDAGTYGIDPATGQPIDDALLAEDPTRLT